MFLADRGNAALTHFLGKCRSVISPRGPKGAKTRFSPSWPPFCFSMAPVDPSIESPGKNIVQESQFVLASSVLTWCDSGTRFSKVWIPEYTILRNLYWFTVMIHWPQLFVWQGPEFSRTNTWGGGKRGEDNVTYTRTYTSATLPSRACYICYIWLFVIWLEFFPNSAWYHWLLWGDMTSNNETFSRHNLLAGNIAKSKTSGGNSTLFPANVDWRPLLQWGWLNFQLHWKFSAI